MHGYKNNIESLTESDEYFRQVLYTGQHSQLVVMSLRPKEDIGMEVHKESDQFFRFEQGHGKVVIDGKEQAITAGDAVIIPAGSEHNIINTSETESLKMYTIYSPPHHRDGVIHVTKEEAVKDTEKFDGVTSE